MGCEIKTQRGTGRGREESGGRKKKGDWRDGPAGEVLSTEAEGPQFNPRKPRQGKGELTPLYMCASQMHVHPPPTMIKKRRCKRMHLVQCLT